MNKMNEITCHKTMVEFNQWNQASLDAGIVMREWVNTMLDLESCDRPGIITLSDLNPLWETHASCARYTACGDTVNFQWWRETALGTRFPRSVRSTSRRIGKGERYLLECWAKVTLNRTAKSAGVNR